MSLESCWSGLLVLSFSFCLTACSSMKSLIVLALLVYSTSALFFGKKAPEWNGLKVGYGIPFISRNAFLGLPRTTTEAVRYGWELDRTAPGCSRTFDDSSRVVVCTGPERTTHTTFKTNSTQTGTDIDGYMGGSSNSYFNGNRYIKNGDPGAMVIFDKNGYIAGIQAGIPKNRTSEYPAPQNSIYHVFNEESRWWVITAYFVEPDTICSKGRTEEEFDTQGTGYMLAFQTGPSPNSLMRIPMDEEEVLPTTKFVEGKCFYAMGMHYWYDRQGRGENMSCDETFPVFLLYDSNSRLTGFGWAFNLHFRDSSFRWEHPEKPSFGMFMRNPPKCLGNHEPVTTLHVYFTRWPQSHVC